jgi:N-acetylglutamate synthase-like GNAT family acetyltransferase
MNLAGFQVRRATLDDIGPLTAMWKTMNFPADELARRITEFQIAQSAAGELLGAIGLQTLDKQGLLHSEAFTDFALAEALRPALWERINSLAASHGLIRIWTQESAPFYRRSGLERAESEALADLPAPWHEHAGEWLTIKLREKLETLVSADKTFELFMAMERAKSQRALMRGKALKIVAQLVAVLICLLVIAGFVYLAKHRSLFQQR